MKKAIILALIYILYGCSDHNVTNNKKEKINIVIVGDSIAEGHPHSHGILHKGGANQPGQISYELGKLVGYEIKNLGIGGNTSTQVRQRWYLDVEPESPTHIFIHVGINDVFKIGEDETLNNIDFFIRYAENNNIKLYFSTIGPHLQHNESTIEKSKIINQALFDYEFIYSNVHVIDYLHWATDGTGEYTNLKDGMFADYTHPNKEGYKSYSQFMFDSIKAL